MSFQVVATVIYIVLTFKDLENVLAESRMMVPDCRKRLEAALEDLKGTLDTCSPPFLSLIMWTRMLSCQGINRQPQEWDTELEWISRTRRIGKAVDAEIFRMVAAGCTYHIWKGRNLRVFRKSGNADQVNQDYCAGSMR
ncbi:hypothetical protein HAX54_034841 [Datura stramonium]|uniref:Uncharacterized protein n=1 Tax=Datura stramonium TaxID=4076 RepID=A0ABS8SFH6_DATST|nr:hypothetical protein [Datura stramonium]